MTTPEELLQQAEEALRKGCAVLRAAGTLNTALGMSASYVNALGDMQATLTAIEQRNDQA